MSSRAKLSRQPSCQIAQRPVLFPEVRRLTASEKLIFVSELWNDLEAHPPEVPVSGDVIAELDRRMERFREHPENFTTWEAVKERVLGPGRWSTSFSSSRPAGIYKAPLIGTRSFKRVEENCSCGTWTRR